MYVTIIRKAIITCISLWLIEKYPDAGKDWRLEENETIKDEMVGWHHSLEGHEFEYARGVGDGHNWVTELISLWILKELSFHK